MNILVGAVILWVVPIFVAHSIGKAKHRSGVLYGLLLGWLGVLIIALLPAVQSQTADMTPEQQLAWLDRNKHSYTQEGLNAAHAEIVSRLQENIATAARECPFCKEAMRRDATVCPHCRHESEAWTLKDNVWWVRSGGVWNYRDEQNGTWISSGS